MILVFYRINLAVIWQWSHKYHVSGSRRRRKPPMMAEAAVSVVAGADVSLLGAEGGCAGY